MAAKTKMRPSKTKRAKQTPLQSSAEVLTLEEAATFLRVSEVGLKSDAIGGLVPGRMVAGEWRFSKCGLLMWLGHERAGQSPEKFSGKALVEHIQKTGVPWSAASEHEAESLIAATKAASRNG
jgi:hypothetical protein